MQRENGPLLERLPQPSCVETGPVLGRKVADQKADLDQMFLGQGGHQEL